MEAKMRDTIYNQAQKIPATLLQLVNFFGVVSHVKTYVQTVLRLLSFNQGSAAAN
jgi:hypothetical protein